jgi:cob(I)alamin adenosyltransferase
VPALDRGLVQVYTGEGKGKTTAALGLVLRATGWQLHSLVVQFMKQQASGEREAIKLLAPFASLEQFGRPGFIKPGALSPEDVAAAHAGLERARDAVVSCEFDLVVLDEVCTAVAFGLIAEQDVLALIDAKSARMELVLTGRGATAGLLARADLVTCLVEVKHPYQQGVPARRGIEF